MTGALKRANSGVHPFPDMAACVADSICGLSMTDRVCQGRFKGYKVCTHVCILMDVGQLVVGACWTNTSGDLSGMEWN